MNSEPLYEIRVYEDYAIITGWLTSDILKVLIRLCKQEGFTHLTNNPDGKGFRLIKGKK